MFAATTRRRVSDFVAFLFVFFVFVVALLSHSRARWNSTLRHFICIIIKTFLRLSRLVAIAAQIHFHFHSSFRMTIYIFTDLLSLSHFTHSATLLRASYILLHFSFSFSFHILFDFFYHKFSLALIIIVYVINILGGHCKSLDE